MNSTQQRPLNVTEFDILVTAAVMDREFCQQLLSDPEHLLPHGAYCYLGQHYQLNPENLAYLLSLQATSLEDLATQLSCPARVLKDMSGLRPHKLPRQSQHNPTGVLLKTGLAVDLELIR